MIMFTIWKLLKEIKRLKEDRKYWQDQYQFVVIELSRTQEEMRELKERKIGIDI